MPVYEFLNVFFHVFHISIILINTTFWMSLRTLWISQITLLLTFVSWVGFGFVYGFGYCFLTDWHWQVKEHLGERDLPLSYIKLVIDRSFQTDVDSELVNQWAIIFLAISLLGCTLQTLRKRFRRRVKTP